MDNLPQSSHEEDPIYKEIVRLRGDYKRDNAFLKTSMFVASFFLMLGIIISIFLILQNQQQVKNDINETQRQGAINQKYIRCIILLPTSAFTDTNNRSKAIDRCAIESQLPENTKVKPVN